MDIILGQGFDDIRFGMKEPEIIAILGFPDKKYESDYDLHLEYFSLKCDLWLLKEDGRLHWIRTSNPQVRIFDRLAIDKNKQEIIPFLSSKLDDKLEIENYSSFETYSFETNWLTLSFEFDRVTHVEFGHFWSDDDEPEIWQIDN